MAKWSTYRKRSGSRFAGTVPPPGTPDFSVTPGIPEHFTLARLAAQPAGLTHWATRFRNVLSEPWSGTLLVAGGSYDLNWGASGDTVLFQFGWSDGVGLVTEWSGLYFSVSP
jgi:hypothetical protein